ncbi:MAG: glycosyltransferase [Planctomycetes bacterium]|nr:glycosyltransferase [Planctomycetota bacterium]
MRVLLVSTLYPSADRPRHGLFVERRFLEVLRSGDVDGEVIRPTPARGLPSQDPPPEVRPIGDGRELLVHKPRFRAVPGLGGLVHPLSVSRATFRSVPRLTPPSFDVVDGHYLFPDGVAAARLAARLRLPLLLTARGSDVNIHANARLAGRWIRGAIRRANAVICVSAALQRRLLEFGAPADRMHVLRNGVDLATFRPVEPLSRAALMQDPSRHLLLMVGHLTPLKGQDRALDALAMLPDCELALIGEGPEREALEARARRLGVAPRTHFLGPVSTEDLPAAYCAADALWMASSREGMPNVVLEALACGTPICGVAVGGVPEVVDTPTAGRLRPTNEPADLAAAARELLDAPPSRDAVRRHAERFSWEATTRGQLELFRRAIAEGPLSG